MPAEACGVGCLRVGDLAASDRPIAQTSSPVDYDPEGMWELSI